MSCLTYSTGVVKKKRVYLGFAPLGSAALTPPHHNIEWAENLKNDDAIVVLANFF